MRSLAAIHVAKKQLGLDDDTYRMFLKKITGKTSAKTMSEKERFKVIEAMRQHGFEKSSKSPQKRLEGKFAPKLQALWIAGWNLGVVKDRKDEALIKFVKRQTGIEHVRFLHYGDDASKVIEALKTWLARDAGVEWSASGFSNQYSRSNGFKVAFAQYRRLNKTTDEQQFWSYVHTLIGQPNHDNITEKQWQFIMNRMGIAIRKAMQNGCI